MSRFGFWVAAGALGAGCLFLPVAQSQPAGSGRPTPRLEPVAETKLLMEGIAEANLRGLAKILREKPQEAEAATGESTPSLTKDGPAKAGQTAQPKPGQRKGQPRPKHPSKK